MLLFRISRHLAVAFLLPVQACGSANADAEAADSLTMTRQAVSAGHQELCDNDTVPSGVGRRVVGEDTLTVRIGNVHGARYLLVKDPSDYLFYVIYPPPRPPALAVNPTSEAFSSMSEFSFRVDELVGKRWWFGSPDAEKVFQAPGIYTVTWGVNLESERLMPQDSVSVLYCPRS